MPETQNCKLLPQSKIFQEEIPPGATETGSKGEQKPQQAKHTSVVAERYATERESTVALKSEREIRRIVFPGIEDFRPAVGHVEYVTRREAEVMLNRRSRKQRVNDRRGMPGETFHFAADGSPAENNLVRYRQNPSRESSFQCDNRALQTRAELVAGRQMLDAFLVFGDGEDTKKQ